MWKRKKRVPEKEPSRQDIERERKRLAAMTHPVHGKRETR